MKKYLLLVLTVLLIFGICGDVILGLFRCYKCNSAADPYTCGEKFMDISIVKQDGCVCCQEQKLQSVWYRTCLTSASDCAQQQFDPTICFNELCNGHETRSQYYSGGSIRSIIALPWSIVFTSALAVTVQCFCGGYNLDRAPRYYL